MRTPSRCCCTTPFAFGKAAMPDLSPYCTRTYTCTVLYQCFIDSLLVESKRVVKTQRVFSVATRATVYGATEKWPRCRLRARKHYGTNATNNARRRIRAKKQPKSLTKRTKHKESKQITSNCNRADRWESYNGCLSDVRSQLLSNEYLTSTFSSPKSSSTPA